VLRLVHTVTQHLYMSITLLTPCAGVGRWLDAGQRRCLVLWRPLAGWADAIYGWARGAGLEDSVTTVDELSSGDEVAGTGAPRQQSSGVTAF